MDAKALPGNDSRYVQLKLSLKEVPDILLDHFGEQDKYVISQFCPAFYLLCKALCCTIWVDAPCVTRGGLGIELPSQVSDKAQQAALACLLMSKGIVTAPERCGKHYPACSATDAHKQIAMQAP